MLELEINWPDAAEINMVRIVDAPAGEAEATFALAVSSA
jgi:hypothetical protein